MIKTVKVKKKLKFVELLQWIKTNDIQGREFKDVNREYYFSVLEGGFLNFDEFTYDNDALYEVEVEEEITEYTEFEAFVVITDKGIIKAINNYHNIIAIRGLLENYEVEQKIYALIENKLQLIWEAE